ncbi:hypothetical protein P691DRAFT_803161 [Macrolepiota fuliginosa MF-IS2]|uniref:Enhancer of mRNA-decapping protein 4 WD40 repeat region domain-containing protein n=1 Tax=Macrolepiota fuliginosa MF-IS2 TaxID=1400762 RepID=A0A9P5XL70_9AGAR|nr:hypothetical protein P691DRAFT_803161 [Macrolepiota fuliginosa MF-IS2]
MDSNRPGIHELFSRGPTPPSQQNVHQQYSPPAQLPSNSSPNHIDALFQNIAAPAMQQSSQQPQQQPQQLSPQQPIQQSVQGADNAHTASSAPVTPVMALTDEPSAPATTVTERQSALLSLLGGPAVSNRPNIPASNPSLPTQVPTPPGSSQRSNASPGHNENQGKILLEQLMAGNPRSNYAESIRSLPQAPSPPYAPSIREGEFRAYGPPEQPTQTSPRVPDSAAPLQSQQQQAPLPPAQQQRPPSPRRSMFDFVSPFDHLSNTTGSVKKKPVPQSSSVSSGTDDSSWTTVPDPKRQSVENLLENISRGQLPQPPLQPSVPAPVSAYESYLGGNDYSQGEQVPSRAPLPPIPSNTKTVPNRNASPRASPPKPPVQQQPQSQPQRSQPRQPDSFITQGPPPSNASQVGGRREKESSPGPGARGGARKAPITQTKAAGKMQSSPSPQPQTIVIDVSQSLEEIQAAQDSVKSTAIALVKQDSVFLPGTTIGATHWVAYAMTRGRVRVISRASGDRTLLQLPSIFPLTSSVTDMAVFNNRLAGVTSDGGFVVWELPVTIEDDVPGSLILCVPPTNSSEALRAVKWHPKDPDTLAVASDNKVYVIDLANTHALSKLPLAHADLHHLGQVFSVPSRIAAFDFDVLRRALATISEDSTLTIWNIHDKLPYATHKIRGEDVPSSLTFVDGGLVVGRKNGTIFQLLSINTKTVLSTIKFINGNTEDLEMFGHINYDSRIQTIWIANSRRDSMIAFKLALETPYGGEEGVRGYFEQVAEFFGPKPTIHFVILTADSDPHGVEAHAACVAAKLPPGELALVAFSVHSSGVDQVLIRREWFDSALSTAPARFPYHQLIAPAPPPQLPQPILPDNKTIRQPQPIPSTSHTQPQIPITSGPARPRTPTSDNENEYSHDGRDGRAKGQKGKNIGWDNGKERDKGQKPNIDIALEASLSQVLTREIKKTEENLHTRLGRLIGKEMDKQNQRLEEARAHEQAEDFSRQEKILKLISTELTRNTTRVVEMAVKNEVQNSVLPSLESITKNEVKAALNDQMGKGLVDNITHALPLEMEKLLFRPDISNHLAHVLATNLTPIIERHVKDAIAKTFIPVYSQQASAMHQELLRELGGEIHSVKSELTAWQNEAFRSHDAAIRELEHTVRTLSDQVKFLSLNTTGSIHHLPPSSQSHNSPGSLAPVQGPHGQSHLRQQQNIQSVNPSAQTYPHPYPQQQQSAPAPAPHQQPPAMHNTWFPPTIAAPQASHPATIPQPPPAQQPQERSTPPIKPDEWDEVYLGVLQTQDAAKLQDLLVHTNPDLIMPLSGPCLVSQAVILTLVHRLSAVVGETQPGDESIKNSLWWLQRAVAVLRPDDKLIIDFIPRVVPNVQQLLITTKQRLGILPGPSTIDAVRNISDIQDVLRRKVSAL